MDKRDETILSTLLADSRTPYVRLARRLGISETAIRKRVKNLEDSGIIQRFTIQVDPTDLGYGSAAIIGIDTEPDAISKTCEKISKMKNVQYCTLSSGDHMIMFEVWCKDNKELARLIDHTKRMDGITKVCPAILLKGREFIR
jgi:Lrp/AsnC family transcriptional regulator for asnA, asnC and gidA